MEKKSKINSQVLAEALSIPQCVNNFAINDTNNYNEIAKLIKNKKIEFIVTLARGSSDCAALFGSYIFAKYLGLPTYSMPPSIITLENSKFNFSNALVIIISQSGLSKDLIECEKQSRKMGAKTLVISNNTSSPLIKKSNYFFNINAGEEKSVAATKTFVLTLMILIKMTLFLKKKNEISKIIELLSEEMICDSKNQWKSNLIDFSVSTGFILGRGIGHALSHEISLKFKELCQEQIEPFSSAEVMHGPKSLIQNSFKLFTISTKDKSGSSVLKDSKKLIKYTKMSYEISFNKKSKFFYKPFFLNDFDPIIIMAKFYPWVINYAINKGLNPDKPRYLTKITNTY